MNTYIAISLLNDFIFCPKSIYFHGLYAKYSGDEYKDTPQIVGTIKHTSIDTQKYSSQKKILQGTSIFCEQYNIGGKIDVFHVNTGELVERKTKISTIYDGYKYQLWGQYFCLKEMGYEVKKLFFHSLADNKRYEVSIPNDEERAVFENHLQKIRNFHVENKNFVANKTKCERCIYAELCDETL